MEVGYKSRNPIVRAYFNKIMDTAIVLANVLPSETVLDFGCQTKQVSKRLKEQCERVLNYDIDKKYSEIKDYRNYHPDVVFCNSVLEHLSIGELENTIKDFKKMNPDMRIVTVVPVEHFAAKILVRLFRKGKSWEDHKINHEQIYKVLNKYLIKVHEKTIYTEAKIAVWTFRREDAHNTQRTTKSCRHNGGT